ncbi:MULTISPECIES: permease [unclassified Bacillus (in: firmicutes)]|uniref:permease n=1 Tax=unclassified Bacillus (in: firmicutes) TaxID=185979 RepID=UPI001BE7B6BA|nr:MULTISPECIES: permease [unclassified Bacillus (in: firmicutes)]MBT2637805.1 permease [Bacillus sp. ISL-39]MBT2661830.1 permease [Bacillus sp. ISL-45]
MFNQLATWLVVDVLNMELTSRLGGALHFFIYDTTKILFLLAVMIFSISFIRSFFPPEKVKEWLEGRRKGVASVMAAVLGVLSPFCSCSTVPLFIGFVEAGIPLGITFTFLISSPIVNEISLVMLFSIFGWKVALIYVLAGMTLAIVAGAIIGKLKMEKHVESYVYEIVAGQERIPMPEGGSRTLTEKIKSIFTWEELKERTTFAARNVVETVQKIWLYLLIGIGIGAFIHGYAPQDLLVKYAGEGNFFAVPIATILGVPLYSNAVGSLPIVEALLNKGVGAGTALAFMMAITALSLPEMILLRKVIKPKLIAVFVGVVATGIILIGYGFNAIL